MAESRAIGQIQSFARFGSRLGLERMAALMDRLGNPQDGMKAIHVAGTNGKGSVCRYIYSVLREHGYRAGLYTSPFVVDFYERMEFGGECVTDSELEECAAPVIEQAGDMVACGLESPTEFEALTAAAFVYFARKGAEFVVLEAGLGGAGDSTNIVSSPLVSVIASISFDHTDRLGDSLTDIAREKAGIIKRGRPVVVNVKDAEAARLIAAEAYRKGAPLVDAGRLEPRGLSASREGYGFDVTIAGRAYSGIRVSMPGAHQVENAVCALCAIDAMRGMGEISTTAQGIRLGMEKARQPGRFEILRGSPDIVLDGAHNEAGAEALARTVAELYPGERTLALIGVLNDKRIESMLASVDGFADEYIATEPDSERRLPAERLRAAIADRTGKPCVAIPDAAQAVMEAGRRKGEFGLIVAAGSLYLIGAVRAMLISR
ncbi:MAG: bifunctional folylpolyglutamate synthase/dihydrofolate synthase [Clostridiales Family XIII bacterium]|jgi:dihydrofolate synthase/folylpolyglutamate synthase|nr:bifunctional folylpolyglutamate synthase/dihydrofolate synthase [Clostridiales Family XIII bacterium]